MKIKFLVVGEKAIFKRLQGIVEKAREETPLAMKLFQERAADGSVMEGMRKLEKESDELTFKLSEDIMDGAINPTVLRDLLHVTDSLDSIFDGYYFIAREVNRSVTSKTSLPMLEQMTETFCRLVDLSDRQLEVFGKLLGANSVDEVMSYRKEIEKLEEEGDDLKDSGFDMMYANQKLFDYFSFQHYTVVLQKLDNILDGVEDMSDMVLAIVNAISR